MKLTKVTAIERLDILKLQQILARVDVRLFLPFQTPPLYSETEKLVSRFLSEGNHIGKIEENDELKVAADRIIGLI